MHLFRVLPIVPASMISSSAAPPVLHDGRRIRRSAAILLILLILWRESVGEELLVFLTGFLVFSGLAHTATIIGHIICQFSYISSCCIYRWHTTKCGCCISGNIPMDLQQLMLSTGIYINDCRSKMAHMHGSTFTTYKYNMTFTIL